MSGISPLTVYALALGTGFLVAALSARPWRSIYLRRGWVDHPGPRKIHSQEMALAGGAAVLTGFLAALGAMGIVHFLMRSSQFEPGDVGGLEMFGIVFGAVAIFLLGFWDDVSDLRPCIKFCGQMLVAAGVVACGIRLPLFFGGPVIQWVGSVLFVVLMINAMNFLDNMNGLCAGLGGIATAALSGWCMMTNRPVLAAICLAAAGGCIGVLPFNYPRASLFVGDAGSHLIGFLAVSLALLACTPLPEAAPRHSWVPLVVLLVPFYDIIQVVVVRTLAGNPVYIGDTNHVSHQLVRAGLSPSVAVLCLWLLGGVAGVAVVTLAR